MWAYQRPRVSKVWAVVLILSYLIIKRCPFRENAGGKLLYLNRIVLVVSALLCGVWADQSLCFSDSDEKVSRIEFDIIERPNPAGQNEAPNMRLHSLYGSYLETKLLEDIKVTTKYLVNTAKTLPKKSLHRFKLLDRALNLYMEKASHQRNVEEHQYDLRWRHWDKNKRVGKEPRLRTHRSTRSWWKVVRLADQIDRDFPKNKMADANLYSKAVALQFLNKEKRAIETFETVIKRYKGSSVLGEVYSSLGDFYFRKSDFNRAKSYLTKALRYPGSKRYQWSLFELGWCNYNLGEYKSAVYNWKKVVALGRKAGKDKIPLREEALRDLVYAFAELKEIEPAISYYRRNGGRKFIAPFLKLLGDTLADQGAYHKAIVVYKKLQRMLPKDPLSPKVQKEVVQLTYITGKYGVAKVWAELDALYANYHAKSRWAKFQKKDVILETSHLIKDQIMYYSTLIHKKAIDNNSYDLNMAARRGYLLFLKGFPKSKKVAGVKFLLADIERHLKNYERAGRYYYEIAALGKKDAIRINERTGRAKNIHQESAVSMVSSYAKDFESEYKLLKKKKPDFKRPKALSMRAKNYLSACALYKKWYKNDRKRVKSCDEGSTSLYYYLGLKDKAIKSLSHLVFHYPYEKTGRDSVAILIPLVKDDPKALLKLSRKILKVPAYNNSKTGTLVRNLLRSVEKESIATEKDVLKRANLYKAQAIKHPADKDAPKLWYNAAIDYMKAGNILASLEAYQRIVYRYPRSIKAKESLLTIAQVEEKQLLFQKASESYLLFFKKYPKDAKAKIALRKSCELKVALGAKDNKSLSVCGSLAKRFPKVAIDIIERYIRVKQRSKDVATMSKLIEKIYFPHFDLTPSQKIIAHHRLYNAYDYGSRQRNKAYYAILAEYRKNPKKVDGEALRVVGGLYFQRYSSQKVALESKALKGRTVDNLVASIKEKAKALTKLEKSYNSVLEVKDAYSSVEVFVALGRANEAFAQQLKNPPSIDGAKKEDVVRELSGQIKGRQLSAKRYYEEARKIAQMQSVYSASSKDAMIALSRMESDKHQYIDHDITPDFVSFEVPDAWIEEIKGDR